MDRGKKIKAVLVMGAAAGGLLSLPSFIRALDRRRESREGAGDLPSIMDGDELKGVCSLDGTPLYADCLGESGHTVFFLHGFCASGQTFHYQKPFFSDRYRVVSLDLRGFGRSEIPESGDYRVERLVEDLKSVVDATNPGEFVVAGHSLGGLVAFKFYERFGSEYKGRLKGLAIIDSSGTDANDLSLRWKLLARASANMKPGRFAEALTAYAYKSSSTYLALKWLVFGKRPPASQVELMQRTIYSTAVESISGAARMVRRFRFEDCLPSVIVPVMLLVGSEDALMVEDRENRRTHALLPNSRLKVFEGAGHCSLMEQPEEFNEALGGFLAECFG